MSFEDPNWILKEAMKVCDVEELVESDLQFLPKVPCYKDLLMSVFINLLANAKDATREKGRIRVHSDHDNTFVRVQVSDTGCGIEAKYLDKLFVPFFTTKPVGSGTGLGLSIAYDIVKKHEGSIQVSSELALGTTFSVSLPLKWSSHHESDVLHPSKEVLVP